MSTCRNEPSLIDQLEADWERLRTTGRLEEVLPRWRAWEPALDFPAVDEMVSCLADADGDPARQDAVLLALLRLGPAEPLARQLVLYRFLPALKRLVGWWSPNQGHSTADWVGLVVSTAWEVIATYPVEARPQKVAANLVWDIRKRLLSILAADRRHAADLTGAGAVPSRAAVAPGPTGAVETAELLRWAIEEGLADEGTVRLIVLSRLGGLPVKDLAGRAGVPPARLRQRRYRTERRLRQALAAT